MEFRFEYMYDVIHSINITIKIVALPLLEPVFSVLLYGYTRCLLILCVFFENFKIHIFRTPALQQNWQIEKSQHFKEKTQYLMNTL